MPTATLAELLVKDSRLPRQKMAVGTRLLPHTFKDHVFVVLDGALAVEVRRATGTLQILEVIGRRSGVSLGRSFLALPRPAVLRALAPTTIVRIEESDFERNIPACLVLISAMTRESGARDAELRERLFFFAEPDVRRRMAGTLIYLLDKIGLGCPLAEGNRLYISQSTIAEVTALSRQTTNRALRDLQALGLVRLEHAMICVLDRAGLETLRGGGTLRSASAPAGPCKLVRPSARLSCYPLTPVPMSLVPLTLRRSISS